MSVLTGAAPIHEFSSLSQGFCAEFDEWSRERKATGRVITDWAEELTETMLAQTMRYGTSSGQVREHPVWVAAAHMFNHQTHHRGQVTTLLCQLGHDPGVTDYFAYVK